MVFSHDPPSQVRVDASTGCSVTDWPAELDGGPGGRLNGCVLAMDAPLDVNATLGRCARLRAGSASGAARCSRPEPELDVLLPGQDTLRLSFPPLLVAASWTAARISSARLCAREMASTRCSTSRECRNSARSSWSTRRPDLGCHSTRYGTGAAVRTVRVPEAGTCAAMCIVGGNPEARYPVPQVHTARRRLALVARRYSREAPGRVSIRSAQVEHHEGDVEDARVLPKYAGVRVHVAQGGAYEDVPRKVPVPCDEDPPRRPVVTAPHGTRYVRHARGWYAYRVRTVVPQWHRSKLPCASYGT